MANRTSSQALDTLVEDLRAAHGDNLASIVLYGSVAGGDLIDARSDHNLLVALHRISAGDLRASRDAVREWLKLGEPMPVYFTVEELNRAADVFPIEFRQMEKARKVLFGADPFELVEISSANLRHQTEYELRTKLIQLRRLYIPASASAEKLVALMSDSLASFAALFRAVLTLHGEEAPEGKANAIHATAQLLGLNGSPFKKILDLRSAKRPSLTALELDELFSDYLGQIESVIRAVDRIERERGRPRPH